MWNTIIELLALVGAVASIGGLGLALIQRYRVLSWRKQLTWDDTLRVAEDLLQTIETADWQPDLVIGIGRSGGIWGGWLAGNLGVLPFAVVDKLFVEREAGRGVEFPGGEAVLAALHRLQHGPLRVLVVEGASARGQVPQEFRQQFADYLRDWDVKLAVLYKNPASGANIDFVGMIGPEPWPSTFPWHQRALYRPYLRDLTHVKKAA